MSKVKFTQKFECPFNLEEVFQVQFNKDNLKGLFDWIISHMKDITVEMDSVSTG